MDAGKSGGIRRADRVSYSSDEPLSTGTAGKEHAATKAEANAATKNAQPMTPITTTNTIHALVEKVEKQTENLQKSYQNQCKRNRVHIPNDGPAGQ